MKNMSYPSVHMPQSTGSKGTVVRHTYYDTYTAVLADKKAVFFNDVQNKAFPLQNIGSSNSRLPTNIGFNVHKLSLQVIIPSNITQEGRAKFVTEFLANSNILVELATQRYCEFSGSEFLPSVISDIDTGATNIVSSNGPLNSLLDIELGKLVIPIEANTDFKFTLESVNAIDTASVGIKMKLMLKGIKIEGSVSGARA